MKKSEKIAMVAEWMESEELGQDELVGKVMEEFEVSEKTARNYISEANNPKGSSKVAAIAEGYESPLADKYEELVDYDSKNYAFLEVENRNFDGRTGKKTSKPQIVTYNRHDLIEFKGAKTTRVIGGKKTEVWSIRPQKEAQGLSVNAVLHIPENFGIEIEVDEWEN